MIPCASAMPESVREEINPVKGPISHLVIDFTELKVFGEGEWKTRKHGKEKRRVWWKVHINVFEIYLKNNQNNPRSKTTYIS